MIYRIKEIKKETPKSVSLIIKGRIGAKPGQFIMLWLPKYDEKPFVISKQKKDSFSITIEEKGDFTKRLFRIKPMEKIGIRGPFGHGFTIKDNSIIVAGGLGMAPAISLVKCIKNSIIIQGARSKEHLLFLKDKDILKSIEKNKNKIIYCTDDGSFGIHGFTTDVLKDMIHKKTACVYTCGPEIMIKKVFDICESHNIECQASLERFMKCGIGICGSCSINDRLVCKDGPVFCSKQLRKLTELGKFARLKSGKKVPIKEYYDWRKR